MDIRSAGRARRTACGAVLAASALTLAACGSNGPSPPPASSTGPGAGEDGAQAGPHAPEPDTTTGVFLVPEIASNAFTYNVELVPPNSTATVTVAPQGQQTTVSLHVYGLKPRRKYGAAAQTKPCAQDPAASGFDYQDERDPAAGPDSPSRDPEYANPENELWLGFTTTDDGSGYSTRTVGWRFRPGEARSLVIFAHHASTEPGDAGDAGARLACLDVDF